MQPETGGDHHRQRPGRRRRRILYPSEETSVEIDKAEQADPDACGEDHDQHEKRAIASMDGSERRLDRRGRVAEDVPEQEDEHAGRDRVRDPMDGEENAANPADREPGEDRGLGDSAQCG